MNLVTIDTAPGNVSMYIAPNNTSYLELGKNATTILIGNNNSSTVINGNMSVGNFSATNVSIGTLNVSNNINLGNGTVTPSLGQLGYKNPGTVGLVTLTGVTQLYQVNLTSGTWILLGNCVFNAPGSYYQLSISNSLTLDPACANIGVGVNGLTAQVTRIVNTMSSTTYYLLASAASGGSVSGVKFDVYRIS